MTEIRPIHRLRARLGLLAVTALASLYLFGTYAAPWLIARDHEAGKWLHICYAPVCHQKPERSMMIDGHAQSVCARCSGLYIGGVFGLLCATFLVVGRRSLPAWSFVALCAPTFIDAVLPWVGLPQLDRIGRLLLAVPAGAIAGIFMAIGLWEVFVAAQRPGGVRDALDSNSLNI